MSSREVEIFLAPRKISLIHSKRRGRYILIADVLAYLSEIERQAKDDPGATVVIRLLRGRLEDGLR